MNSTKEIIGDRINSALELRNMKQKDLAKILGVTDNTVSYYVNGTRTPNAEQIIAISQALNVSSDYILGLSTVTNLKELDLWTKEFKRFMDLARQNYNLYFDLVKLSDTVLNCNNLTDEQKKLVYDASSQVIWKLLDYIRNINFLAADIDKYINAYCDFYTNHKIVNKNKRYRPYTKNHAIIAITQDYLHTQADKFLNHDEFGGFDYILCDQKTLHEDLVGRNKHANDNEKE